MPVARRRRIALPILVVTALGVLTLVGSARIGNGNDIGTAADDHAAAVTTPVADHGLPVLRRHDRQDDGPLALALLATLVVALAAATPRARPTPVPVPVDDARRRRAVAGRLPRRRGPPPRA